MTLSRTRLGSPVPCSSSGFFIRKVTALAEVLPKTKKKNDKADGKIFIRFRNKNKGSDKIRNEHNISQRDTCMDNDESKKDEEENEVKNKEKWK